MASASPTLPPPENIDRTRRDDLHFSVRFVATQPGDHPDFSTPRSLWIYLQIICKSILIAKHEQDFLARRTLDEQVRSEELKINHKIQDVTGKSA